MISPKHLVLCALSILWALCGEGQVGSPYKLDPCVRGQVEFGLNSDVGVVPNTGGQTRPVISGGIFGQWNTGTRWFFTADINYTFAGFYAEKITYINTPVPYYRKTTIDGLHLVDMPLVAHYLISKKLSVGIGYGLTRIAKARKEIEEWNQSPAEQLDLDARTVDPAIIGEIRYRETCPISFRLRYRYGLSDVLHNHEPQYLRWVSVGIVYDLPVRKKQV